MTSNTKAACVVSIRCICEKRCSIKKCCSGTVLISMLEPDVAAAWTQDLLEPDVASTQSSLKAIPKDSPNIQLASKHCFLLKAPPIANDPLPLCHELLSTHLIYLDHQTTIVCNFLLTVACHLQMKNVLCCMILFYMKLLFEYACRFICELNLILKMVWLLLFH
eukprot:TRINITY_DN21310_c1_g1_i3.p1 TRINITY_DN21310_c1_g1~~TRINITY_DN21310_c1_g1_i3.p1  ORF type:complete len:164 (+),score=19.77 TRINITY_DN21310_c1_g1_i3:69-560(+)